MTTSSTPDSTPSPSYPTTLNEAGRAFQKRVENPRMFRAYMLAKQTTLGVTGAYLDVIELDHVRLILPSAFTTKDLFGRTSTAAILSAAEMCSAALLVLQLRNQRCAYRPLLSSVHVETIDPDAQRRATPQTMSFETESGDAHARFVAHVVSTRPTEGHSQEVVVMGRDEVQERTHRIRLTWTLFPPEE